MPIGAADNRSANSRVVLRGLLFGAVGLVVGGFFLYLALRGLDRRDFEAVLLRFDGVWLAAGVAVYLASIALRCVRWGILLRSNAEVKWRHAGEALLAGYAANYLLPGRIGELFRVDYAMRLFHMSRFTSLGTIVVERVCDGVVLVCALWTCLALLTFESASRITYPPWAIGAGITASAVFGSALVFVLVAGHLDLRRFKLPQFLLDRWKRLIDGVSSVARGQGGAVILCSLGIWMLEVLALGCVARAFGAALSVPQTVVLMVLGALSTLIPTAPGFLGTFQFVFAQVLAWFGYPESTGVVMATSIQVFCFGSVTLIGVFVLLSRSGLAIIRALRLTLKEPDR
jgi:glycosyltransferase 2 family protein